MNLIFMGDSTMQKNDESTYPQVGWPQVLPNLIIKKDINIINFAKNGRSTKSFIDEGLFNKTLEHIKSGDYCLIQFGHNDEKINDPTRYTNPSTTFKENLNYFIDKIKEKNANIILLTPIYRRCFIDEHKLDDNCHKNYSEAIIEVGRKNNILVIDLTSLTKTYLEKIGMKESRKFFMNFDQNEYPNYPLGKEDNTHLRMEGAEFISKLFIDELEKINHPLRKIFKEW